MIVCVCCKERKPERKFLIKTKLVSREVIFKVCDDCGKEENLEDSDWKNDMLDRGALDFYRPFSKKESTMFGYHFSKYGITSEDFDKLYSKQLGRCAICNTHQIDLNKTLSVDHCHTTGKVRGLLCMTCNAGLGMFKDNLNYLDNAFYYIKNSRRLP